MLQQVNAPKQIDYLSLDVEGAESIVMKSFPWDTHRFSVLTVERPHTDLVGMLRRHHYRFLCLQDAPDPLSDPFRVEGEGRDLGGQRLNEPRARHADPKQQHAPDAALRGRTVWLKSVML